MKISNSKKELASIIRENGGWRGNANLALFGKVSGRCYMLETDEWPEYDSSVNGFYINARDIVSDFPAATFANWHQTILSRAEYFHLHPAPDADGWIEWLSDELPVAKGTIIDVKYSDGDELHGAPCGVETENLISTRGDEASAELFGHSCWGAYIIAYRLHKPEKAKPEFCESVMRSIPEPEYKPSIEQLMQIHCDRAHALSERKAELIVAERQESEALDAIKAACKEAGFDISPIENLQENQEPELVITDWRDLRVGDYVEFKGVSGEWEILDLESEDDGAPIKVDESIDCECVVCGWVNTNVHKWRFIRRP